MVILPDQYVIEKFCQYSGYPKHNKRTKVWTAGCPICREGTSWNKKRRLYYKVDKNYVVCFNCGWKGSTLDYIKHVTGLSFREIMKESNSYDTNNIAEIKEQPPSVAVTEQPSLPEDSINLLDEQQTSYWLANTTDSKSKKVVKDAINLISSRLLNIATNRPKTLWLSLKDYTHKNRVVLPFYSTDSGKIIFYQSRSIYPEPGRPKYLSKSGAGQSIFNINNIDTSLDSIFIFEGPIDSCFVKNGVAVAGITNGPGEDLNSIQKQQLNDFRLYKKIWVLDSQWLDETSYTKTNLLIDQNQTVFIWPSNIGKRYKDLNELCIDIGSPGIGYRFIEKNSFTGMKAKLLLKQINR